MIHRLAFLLSCAALAIAAESASVLTDFVVRRDDRLYEGGKEFRFIGVNMPGLMLPYDFTLRLPERMGLPTPWEQEDAFRTLAQMGARVVRLWNLPIRAPHETAPGGGMTWHHVQGPGVFNEDSFTVIDHVLALGNKYGVRVMFSFCAEAGDYLGGNATYAAHRGKKRDAFYTDPQIKDDYKATVRHCIERVNTVTGIRYRDDKALFAWQFGNEMDRAPVAWLAEMAAYIKSLDPNHLVAETRHRHGLTFVVDPNIDLYNRHYYPNYRPDGTDWRRTYPEEMAPLVGKRPFFIGEFGPYIDGTVYTHENMVPRTREYLEWVRGTTGVAGAMLWSMYFHHRDGGFYWHQIFTYPSVWSYHWPGFPSADAQRERELLTLWREEAFRIQGLPVPPVPVPVAPELIPFADEPLFSWRGSAGADSYAIERAEAEAGPWQVIAPAVSDADVAYRPLFSDRTARVGGRYWYRVRATNASGTSRPSNVVGPVTVARLCLVDELQDSTVAQAHSDGLKPSNTFNALYAEYLFRAKGAAGDWISYCTPGPMLSLHLIAFHAKEAADLTAEASADGAVWTAVPLARRVRGLASPPGGAAGGQRRTQVDYEAAVPDGMFHLRLRWGGPLELDRVEIRHR